MKRHGASAVVVEQNTTFMQGILSGKEAWGH